MKYSIVIPCYNEKENIPVLLERFSDAIKDRRDIEVVIVDNGSNDGSAEVLDELCEKYFFVRRTKVLVNQGYGYGILCGLKEAKGEILGWTHADLQTDPADVIKAVGLFDEEDKDITYVKGNRKGRPISDVFFTFGMSMLELILTGRWLPDINAQPNMFSRAFYAMWENPPYDFSLDLYAFYLAKRHGMKIKRFPVCFPKRLHGTSKWNTSIKAKWKFIKRTFDYSIKLKKKGVM